MAFKKGENETGFFYSVFSPSPPPIVDGTIVEIDFIGLNQGVYGLELAQTAFGNKADAITNMELFGGQITVNSVPIPSTLLLLGGGICALVGSRRKNRG